MNIVRTRIKNQMTELTRPATCDLARKGGWALADQALISITNFVMTVLLVRTLSPSDFGLYALAYTALIFLNTMQSALVSQPLVALGAPRYGTDAVEYTTATMWMQVVLAAGGAGIMTALAVVCLWRWHDAATVMLMCALATPSWQMQEFIRRVLYIRSRPSAAFANDLLSFGVQLLLLVLLWEAGYLTTVTALFALTATSTMGFVLGLWQARDQFSGRSSLAQLRETIVENWTFGRWLVGGNLATWTSGRLYPILAAGFVSVAASGAMKAIQTILGPMNVLVFSLDTLLGPKAARTNAHGGLLELRAFVKRMQIFMLLTVGIYCVVVSIFSAPILRILYGERYTGYSWLLIIMAANYVFYAFRGPMILAMTVTSDTRSIFRIWVDSSIASLTIGLAAAYAFGLPGIGVGILVNGVILQSLTWRAYLRSVRPVPTDHPDLRTPAQAITPTDRHRKERRWLPIP